MSAFVKYFENWDWKLRFMHNICFCSLDGAPKDDLWTNDERPPQYDSISERLRTARGRATQDKYTCLFLLELRLEDPKWARLLCKHVKILQLSSDILCPTYAKINWIKHTYNDTRNIWEMSGMLWKHLA